MTCPFLREAQVKFCQTSPFRKMLVRSAAHGTDEKCTSPGYVGCSVYVETGHQGPTQNRCPFFGESLTQYCSIAPVPKYIPYSESMLCRCGTESYRYCELYLTMARPAGGDGPVLPLDARSNAGSPAEEWIDDMRVPNWLLYTTNHLWVDRTESGDCHVGIDAVLAKALGTVDSLNFEVSGEHPSVVLEAGGAEFEVIFPRVLQTRRVNAHLRLDPHPATADPYGTGWLFEGSLSGKESVGLIPGNAAAGWMRSEVERLSHHVHEHILPAQPESAGLAADGGSFAPGLLRTVGRERASALFNEFFGPYASWKKR